MSGYVPFIAVVKSLKKIHVRRKGVKNNQSGAGGSHIQVISPTKQVLNQAKETLKRNIKEAESKGIPSPDTSQPKKKRTYTKKTSTKSSNKSRQAHLHEKYKK